MTHHGEQITRGAPPGRETYSGIAAPAITPLDADGRLDQAAVERLWERFDRHGVDPFILGTTGEAMSLPVGLKTEYIRLAGRLKRPGRQLFAGIGTNCLDDSLALAAKAFEAGADAVVATLPPYYALDEAEMRSWFIALADQMNGPLFLYNIPSTTHMSIPLALVDELSQHPNIIGMKDSERGDDRLRDALARKRYGFCHLLGWAARSAEALELGSDGLVPGTANLSPRLYRELYDAAREGRTEEAARLQKVSDALGETYQKGRSLGQSLAALKAILAGAGICGPRMMAPLRTNAAGRTGLPAWLAPHDIDLIKEWI